MKKDTDWIEREIATIQAAADDDEAAHSMEDGLHVKVLEYIRDGKFKDPAKAAELALETCSLNFARWCA